LQKTENNFKKPQPIKAKINGLKMESKITSKEVIWPHSHHMPILPQ